MSADATCRPLLAFLALGAAATAALVLVLIAYKAAGAREQAALDAEPLSAGGHLLTERARRSLAESNVRRGPVSQGRLAAAA